MLALAGLELGIILTAAVLAWFAVQRGLAPLVDLGRDIDGRQIRTGEGLQPLDLAKIPVEVHPPVRAINQLFGRLDAAINVLRDFIADASHQMKTPLASLRVHLALLERSAGTEPADPDTIAEIDKSTRHLDRLVAQLIALARAEESAVSDGGHQAQSDLAAVAADVVSVLAPIAATKDVELALETEPHAVIARIEPAVLHEALANLVDNAIRYNRSGGSVTVRVHDDGERCAVQICDDGPGIALEFRARVFDRFYRMPSTDRPPGSGLGLSIVRTLLRQSSADIQLADGDGGKGLTVTVSFAKFASDGRA